jgi:hypothetical protein
MRNACRIFVLYVKGETFGRPVRMVCGKMKTVVKEMWYVCFVCCFYLAVGRTSTKYPQSQRNVSLLKEKIPTRKKIYV